MRGKNTTVVSVSLPNYLAERIEQYAAKHKLTRTDVVVKAVKQFFGLK